ncbi:MAG: extracellular solute-binding protein [Elusimicrobia bacterium]|nr:extracellular solute-binding protein [Elusimicrobiota bacterium]
MPGMSRRDFLKIAVLAGTAPTLLASCAGSDDKREVNFFNWSTYIAKDTLPKFSLETGIVVNYSVFSDEEDMFAKLRSGAMGYDLTVATDYMIPRLKALNLIDPYPTGALKNIGNIDSKFRDTPYVPQNAYTVPYLWGTTGIGYNKKHVSKRPDSWWDLWDPKYKGKISMLDNARDCVGIALLMKGYPQNTDSDAAFQAVEKLLISQKPLLKQYSSATYVDSLINGEVDLAMAWSGDVIQATKENPELDYVIPKEGSYMWVDNMCLVKGSRHRADTLRLVDYLIEGKVAADIANFVRYGSPNAAAKPYLDKTLLDDPRVFPPPSVQKRLEFYSILPPDLAQTWINTWSDVKAA